MITISATASLDAWAPLQYTIPVSVNELTAIEYQEI